MTDTEIRFEGWQELVHRILQQEFKWAWSRKQQERKFRRPIDYEDLAQEGFIALMDAVRLFDAEKGTAFKTYAWCLIRRRVARYVEKNISPIYVGRWGDLAQQEKKKVALACRLFSELITSNQDQGAGLEWAPYIADQDAGVEEVDARDYREYALSVIEAYVSDKHWNILRLRFIEDMGLKEMAKELGMATSGASHSVKRALEEARAAVEEAGLNGETEED